jgi:hypothetical protein
VRRRWWLVSGTVLVAALVVAIVRLPGPRAALPTSPPSSGSVAPSIPRSPAGLPDPARTPGSINPNVTQSNIAATICKSGWTATIRPPSAYTSALKVVQIEQYGYADKKLADYEEDHLVPLELGGAPRDPANLWPEPRAITSSDGTAVGADAKDHLENALNREVCSGALSLADAQRLIAGDWIAAWRAAGNP